MKIYEVKIWANEVSGSRMYVCRFTNKPTDKDLIKELKKEGDLVHWRRIKGGNCGNGFGATVKSTEILEVIENENL